MLSGTDQSVVTGMRRLSGKLGSHRPAGVDPVVFMWPDLHGLLWLQPALWEAKVGRPLGPGRREAKETMSLQLLLIVAAIGVVPVVGKLIKAIVELLIRLVATALTVMIVVIVLAAFASHGKLF